MSGVAPSAGSPAAVVTGGAAGIGAAICRAFLDAGHHVVCLDRDRPDWSHPRLTATQVDLMQRDATAAAASDTAARFGVTHLVHNAGVIRPDLVEAADPGDLADLAMLHLGAPLILLQAFLPGMKAAGGGRVILVSSRAALGVVTRTSYAATKAGMIGMGRTWALELAKHAITVNMVAPGPIGTTAMFEALVPAGSAMEAKLAGSIPVGRLGLPADVAHAVMFFAHPQSGFVTGQTMYVCGGASIGLAPV